MVPYNQRLQSYVSKSIDKLFRTIQFRQGVRRVIGTASLEDLSNVSGATPTDGEVLEWSQAQGLWIPGDGGGEGTIPNLQSVMDEGSAATGLSTLVQISTSNQLDFTTISGATFAYLRGDKTSGWDMQWSDGSKEAILELNTSNAYISYDGGGGAQSIFIDPTAMTVTDPINSKGLEYAGAYKANFTQYSLVDKDYVDTQITGIPGLAIGNPITGGGANRILYENSSQLLTSDDDLLFDGLGFALHTAIDSNKAMSLNGGISSHYTTLYVQQGSSGTANRYAIEAVGIAGHAFDSVGIKSTAQNTSTGDAIAGEFSATAPTGSGNAYGIKVTSSNVGTGIAYGIYQSGNTAINYFAGQLKLGHTAGTAGQFLKAVDTDGNAEWADVPAGATSIGELSDAATPATDNVGLGSGALSSITTGDYNVAVGVNAGLGALGASRCVFIGNDAGRNVTGRSDCVAVGEGAMGVGTGGNTNIAVGANALSGVTGQGNVAMGNSAGSSITSGGFSLFLGRNANGLNTQSYQIAIGTSVTTTQASSLALGRSGRILLHGEFATAGRTKLGVNLGNTYSAPTANLHVKGNASDATTFLVQNGAGSSIFQVDEDGTITGNGLGDVSKVGTPVNNQIGVWTGDGTLEGDSNFNWNGAQIEVTDADSNLTEVRADWLRVYNETDDANLFLYGYGTGHRGEIVLGAANGTRGAETATLNGNTVATIAAYGHSGTGFRQGGQAIFAATENYTEGSAYGTRFVLQTVADGSTSLATRYATDGNGDHNFTGNVKVDGQAYSATHTLTAAASVAPDFDNSNVQTVTLDQATTLANPTNLKDGATYIVIVKQPAGANHTLAFGTAYKFEGGTAPTITAANGATDVLTFVSDGTNLYGAAALNFS